MDLGLVRQELGQDPTQAQRVLAQRRAHPVVAGGGRVPLVEHEIEHLEHRRQAGGSVGPLGHLERDLGLRQRALGPHDALGHGGLPDEEGAGDLVGGEPPEEPQRERDARLGGEHGVTRDEDEAQKVVTEIVVGLVEIDVPHLRRPPTGLAASRPSSSCLRSSTVLRRSRSTARRLPTVMSQAPGLSGTPDVGHCSSAAARASWARSSPTPTSPT